MAPDARVGNGPTGADHFWIAQRLTLSAWAVGAALQVCLFARPTPLGLAYVGDWQRYFFRALLYEGLENYLVALPFLAFWLVLFDRTLIAGSLRWVYRAHVSALAVSLFLTQFDHEIMRFVGTRLTPSYLRVYATLETSWPVVLDSIRGDRGGPGVAVLLWIGGPVAFVAWARRTLGTARPLTRRRSVTLALLTVALPVLVPIYVRQNLGGKGPTRRVESLLLSAARDVMASSGSQTAPPDLSQLVRQYQEEWLAENADRNWRFTSTTYPYLREPIGPAPEPSESPTGQPRWNVVIVQLETFRAWNMGLTRPTLERSPTPFLDALGRSDRGAYWTRHSSFGPPTVDGVLAWNCSQLPHSGQLVLPTFTYVELDCLPDTARRHGYRTEVFTGFDPDWDNERLWWRRWYDRFNYYRDAHGDDRALTRHTAARLKELGQSSQPFLATVVCITNHYPFASVDVADDVAGHGSAAEQILNTMHHDDMAIDEFISTLRNEPWFDRTIFVFIGDHGYSLAEHGATPGQITLYRESTWVPLVIYGPPSALRAGRHDEPASLLDVAPTVADLLGIRDVTPWQGHSLVSEQRAATVAFARDDAMFAETRDVSVVVDPHTGVPQVFDPRSDPLQLHELGRQVSPEVVRRLVQRAEGQRRLNDFLIRSNRIRPSRGAATALPSGGAVP